MLHFKKLKKPKEDKRSYTIFATDEELIERMANNLTITYSDAIFLIEELVSNITDICINKGCVNIKNLGTIRLRTGGKVKFTHPTTGETFKIARNYRIVLEPCTRFKTMAKERVKKNFKASYEIRKDVI